MLQTYKQRKLPPKGDKFKFKISLTLSKLSRQIEPVLHSQKTADVIVYNVEPVMQIVKCHRDVQHVPYKDISQPGAGDGIDEVHSQSELTRKKKIHKENEDERVEDSKNTTKLKENIETKEEKSQEAKKAWKFLTSNHDKTNLHNQNKKIYKKIKKIHNQKSKKIKKI